jgi:hypothetical protein
LKDLHPENATPEQRKKQQTFNTRRKVEMDFEELCRQAFIAMAEFRDLTNEVFEDSKLDITDELVKAVHWLPQIEYYMEILATGTKAEKLELARQGVISKWQKLHQSTRQAQSAML